MAKAASKKNVTPSTSKGKNFVPGPGTGGKIPGPGVASTPRPKPAINSGKKIKG